MKLEDFNKMVSQIEKEQTDSYNKAVALYESGERSLSAYEVIGAYKKVGWYSESGFFSKQEKQSSCLSEYSDIAGMVESLQEFESEYKECNEINKSSLEKYEDIDDEYISFFGFKYSYYYINENKLSSEISRLIREKIKDELKPSNVEKSVMPDCKIVQLFKDGAIDWETLQMITYKDCKIG